MQNVNGNAGNRSSAGLRASLFEELEAIKSGDSNPARARAVAMLANSILQSVVTEIEYHKYVADVSKAGATAKLGALELALPNGIELGESPAVAA